PPRATDAGWTSPQALLPRRVAPASQRAQRGNEPGWSQAVLRAGLAEGASPRHSRKENTQGRPRRALPGAEGQDLRPGSSERVGYRLPGPSEARLAGANTLAGRCADHAKPGDTAAGQGPVMP